MPQTNPSQQQSSSNQMELDKKISIGNIISWAIILIGLAAGYTRMQSASEQNAKDVAEAKMIAQNAETRINTLDSIRQAQISDIKVDVAVIKQNVISINEKLFEIRRTQTNNTP